MILLDVEPFGLSEHAESGRIVHVSDSRFVVQAGGGAVEIRKLQPEGKRPMSADDFLRGRSVAVGDRLSSEVRDD